MPDIVGLESIVTGPSGAPRHLVDLGNGAFAEKVIMHGSDALLPGDVELEVSATVAAAANNQTLVAGGAGRRTYITGFAITGGGATAASIIDVTITGLTNTITFHVAVPAGATVGVTPLIVEFKRPIPASADNTAIVVNVPSFGAGNTKAAAVARGFHRAS